MARPSDLRFTFHPAHGPALDVVRFTLTEGLSQPFQRALELSSPQGSDYRKTRPMPPSAQGNSTKARVQRYLAHQAATGRDNA
jgi:hypothetical protein